MGLLAAFPRSAQFYELNISGVSQPHYSMEASFKVCIGTARALKRGLNGVAQGLIVIPAKVFAEFLCMVMAKFNTDVHLDGPVKVYRHPFRRNIQGN